MLPLTHQESGGLAQLALGASPGRSVAQPEGYTQHHPPSAMLLPGGRAQAWTRLRSRQPGAGFAAVAPLPMAICTLGHLLNFLQVTYPQAT